MLIQAQNQNERSNSNTKSSIKQEETEVVDGESKPNDEQSRKSEPEVVDDDTKELVKLKENDNGDDNEVSVDDINIDPRTYCKLGHFHLLLEDYPKGMPHSFPVRFFLTISLLFQQQCQRIKNSTRCVRIIGKTLNFSMVWDWCTITTMRTDGEYQIFVSYVVEITCLITINCYNEKLWKGQVFDHLKVA